MSIIPPPKLVVIESPFRANEYYSCEQMRLYLKHCMADSYLRGEAPMASHHLSTEVLDDSTPYERALGIRCGMAWGKHADLIAVYQDFGLSGGMREAVNWYKSIGKKIEWRSLPEKIVRSIRDFGECNGETDALPSDIHSPAVSFIGS